MVSKIFKVGLTIFSAIVLAYAIGFISERVNILEKFTIAINDVDFSDVYYRYRPTPKPDNNIVIVNIGYLDRAALAGLIKSIADNNPKVIGGDIIFSEKGDSIDLPGTVLLINEIRTIKKFILVNSYQGKTEDGFDLVEGQSPAIKKY